MNPKEGANVSTIQPAAEKRAFYNIAAQDDERHAEILIYDEIASGCIADVLGLVSAKTFVRELQALDVDTITLRINSPGGDVFDGVSIYNALVDHPAKVTVKVDGLAASIASVIMLAGDERHVGTGAMVMIHNPWCMTMGESKEMRKTAQLLDDIRDSILDVYEERTGTSRDELAAAMGDETWYSAKDALAIGFATVVDEEPEDKAVQNIARFDERVAARHRFEHVPDRVAAAFRAPVSAPVGEPDANERAVSSSAHTVSSDMDSEAHTEWLRMILTAR